jgi:hypothetical protein
VSELQNWIANQEKDTLRRSDELRKLTALTVAFPDLKRHVNRWQKERFCSKGANAKATDYDMSHNCGCCADSPLEVWPYTEQDGVRIYSDPPSFTVGEKNGYGYGETPYPGWDAKMREANIPEPLIDRVRMYLEAHPPEEYPEDEEQ